MQSYQNYKKMSSILIQNDPDFILKKMYSTFKSTFKKKPLNYYEQTTFITYSP